MDNININKSIPTRDSEKFCGSTIREPVEIRETGEWSSISKLSCIELNLWSDPYFHKFNFKKKVKRSPLISFGYYVRFKVCEMMVTKLIENISTENLQIVILGAGNDTLFFRVMENKVLSKNISNVFEIDFPTVIHRKQKIINEDPILKKLACNRLILVSGDLRDINQVGDTLIKSGFNPTIKTLFYSECVLNYLETTKNNEILRWITTNVSSAFFLAYEQTNSFDTFGQIMVKHFQKQACPILGIKGNDTLELQKKQLLDSGFKFAQSLNVYDIFLELYKEIEADPTCSINELVQRLQFDEFEAWIGTCLHYSVRVGCTQNNCFDVSWLSKFNTENEIEHQSLEVICPKKSFVSPVQIRSHTSILRKDSIFIIGGSNTASKLQNHVQEIPLNPLNQEKLAVFNHNLERCDLLERNYCDAVYCQKRDSIIFCGGRKAPSSPKDFGLYELRFLSQEGSEICDIFEIYCENVFQNENAENSPCSRWRHSIILLQNSEEYKLFLFGGKTLEVTLGDFWEFNFTESHWEHKGQQISPKEAFPSPRHSHVMVNSTNADNFFIIGGMSGDNLNLSDDAIWEYDDTTEKWKRWEMFDKYCRRIGHNVSCNGNSLYIVGGYGRNADTTLTTMLTVMSLSTFVVQTYAIGLDPERPVFLPFDFSAHIINQFEEGELITYLCVFGGGGNCFSFGTHFNKDFLLFAI